MHVMMFPKERVYCEGCQRKKILFESQVEADCFIHDNSEDIKKRKGRAPIRSYYCRRCGGYHITSKHSEEYNMFFERRDEKIVDKMAELAKERENPMSVLNLDEKIVRVARRLHEGRIDTAEMWLKECRTIITAIKSNESEREIGWRKKVKRINSLANMIEVIRSLGDEDSAKWEDFFNKEGKTVDEVEICQILVNIKALNELNRLFAKADIEIENKDYEVVKTLRICSKLIRKIQGPFNIVIRNQLRKRISGRKDKIHQIGIFAKKNKRKNKYVVYLLSIKDAIHRLIGNIRKYILVPENDALY